MPPALPMDSTPPSGLGQGQGVLKTWPLSLKVGKATGEDQNMGQEMCHLETGSGSPLRPLLRSGLDTPTLLKLLPSAQPQV